MERGWILCNLFLCYNTTVRRKRGNPMKLQLVKDNSILKGMKFKEAFATNTRLMGVVGVMVKFIDAQGKEIVHIYHLDYESYGIDGFKEWRRINEHDLRRELSKVIGGLGGSLESISFEELIYLLKTAHAVQDFDIEEVQDLLKCYPSFLENDLELEKEFELELLKRLSGDLNSDEQRLHYFMMRFVGLDFLGLQGLTKSEVIESWKDPISLPSTLIKNTVEKEEELADSIVYSVSSLIDYEDTYKLVNSQIEVSKETKEVISYLEMNHLLISPNEASLRLAKKEYIAVYTIKKDGFRYLFEYKKPHLMMNIHQTGSLYTEFNPTNQHVEASTYYLNGDIFAVYYITDSDQLIISTFNEGNLELVESFFNNSGLGQYLGYEGDFEADTSLIYEFVNSGYESFYDFLNRV